MKRAFAAALATALALHAPAQAEAPPPAWQGVWEGTIGTLPVRACLRGSEDGFSVGSYYYLSRKRPIQLMREDDGRWSERETGETTGTWSITPQGKMLAGQWSNGKRRLPLALAPVAWQSEYDNPCEADAFTEPRMTEATLTSQPAKVNDFAYTRTSWNVGANFENVELTSFAYPVSQPGDAAINAALRLDPARREDPVDWRGCVQQSLGSLGLDGDFAYVLEPIVANPAFLVASRQWGGFCGGAHPFSSHDWMIWDRATGDAIDLADWLNANAVEERIGGGANLIRITPALRDLALDYETVEDGECREIIAITEFWTLGLSDKGLLLSPSLPHVAQACADDAEVPFAKLSSYLSAEGQSSVARMK